MVELCHCLHFADENLIFERLCMHIANRDEDILTVDYWMTTF